MKLTVTYIVGNTTEEFTYEDVEKFKLVKNYLKIWFYKYDIIYIAKENVELIKQFTVIL